MNKFNIGDKVRVRPWDVVVKQAPDRVFKNREYTTFIGIYRSWWDVLSAKVGTITQIMEVGFYRVRFPKVDTFSIDGEFMDSVTPNRKIIIEVDRSGNISVIRKPEGITVKVRDYSVQAGDQELYEGLVHGRKGDYIEREL